MMKKLQTLKSFNTNHSSDFVSSHQTNKNLIKKKEKSFSETETPDDDPSHGIDPSFQAPKLSRTISVNSSSKLSKNLSSMNRTMSIRRSTSIKEGYDKIYDQHMEALETQTTESDDVDDEVGVVDGEQGTVKEKKKGINILKACKRVFGLRS